MLLTLQQLLPDILNRVEEALPSDTPPGPIFWDLVGEVYPAMVDGIFEAALITGVVQLSSQLVTLAAGVTYFGLQPSSAASGGYASNVAPAGVVAPIRLKAPYPIKKTTLSGLDQMYPQWQKADPGTQIKSWFPLGVSGFGIFPQLEQEQQVVMDFLVSPITTPPPYTGAETIPLQNEFADLLAKYGAAQLRSKENGAEAEEAETVFTEYLSEVKSLSLFQARLDSLVYSAAFGGKSGVNPRTAV